MKQWFSAAPTFGLFHLFHYTCKYGTSTERKACSVTKIAKEEEIYKRVVQEQKWLVYSLDPK